MKKWTLGILVLVVLVGCNAERINDLRKAAGLVDDEISLLAAQIIEAQSKLKLLNLTDLQRANIEIDLRRKEVERLQKEKVTDRLKKEATAAQAEDDAMFNDLSTTARELTPLGYGGLIVAGLSLLRGFFRRQAYTSAIKSVQPLVDNASREQITAINAVQTPGAKRLVDGVQGKVTVLPL